MNLYAKWKHILKNFFELLGAKSHFSHMCQSYGKTVKVKGHIIMASAQELYRVHFQVFGRVQGVFFRKFTQEQGKVLELRGFCRNTRVGTVAGVLEGPKSQVEKMKSWLRSVGSPMSQIDKTEFSNEEQIEDYSFKEKVFGIKSTI